MKLIKTIAEMQQFSKAAAHHRQKIGVVPTMGFLHEGHMSLIDRAHNLADVVIVTIFVNPTQFGPNEDLAKYPRDFDQDWSLCEKRGVDAVFAPSPEEMYFPDRSAWVIEEKLSQGLCGQSRPAHFRGVTTVVAKLFNATLPDVAIFGQKDAQQAMIIKRMARDLNFPVEIVVAPIVREADGLAMSSRNKYLSADERIRALSISAAMRDAHARIKAEGGKISGIAEQIAAKITASGGRVDYVEVRDADSLEPASAATRCLLIAAAAYFGPTRLIDNILINLD
ncbi:MAG: pantoate--beta-alanine ligase [Victivallaceae bacterium]|jgi:pantoate--beta-alanine ligase